MGWFRRLERGAGALLVGLALAAGGSARAMPAHPCLAVDADCSLREIARTAGVRIGAAAQPRFIADDPPYGPLLAAEFDSITAENQMKWPAIHPAEADYDFAPADALVDFARAHDMRMRGHTLLWANPTRIPDWVNAAPDADTLRGWMVDHVTTVVGRYADDVDQWDVVNEPLANLGTTLYDNVFHQLLGPGYIAEVFHAAHAADPDASLFLNEVLVETPGNARFDAFYDLVVDLLGQGVPIHGVGFQGHLLSGIIDPDPAAFHEAVQAFADLGLLVEITELDVAMPGTGEARFELQRQKVHDFMAACLTVEACEGVTFWGVSDAHTWIDSFYGPGLIPLLFDEDYQRKPAYHGARDALLERLAARVPEPCLLWLAGLAAAAIHSRT